MTVVVVQPHERRFLRHYEPGPSGQLGGYQKHVNWVVDNIDADNGELRLDPIRLDRTIRYITRHGPGGPNQSLRNALIPPLRRAGIDLAADWRA